MQREIMNDLVIWKDKPRRKPLVVTGVRQCGKTFVLKQFGKEYFTDCVYLNFEENEELSGLFDYNLDVVRIIERIERTVIEKKIRIGETLLIFDEIQACPKAITSLKYFCEKLSELHVIAAGSLLGVVLRAENISFPVGKVDRMTMYPMSFSEFVTADGGRKYIDEIWESGLTEELPDLCSVPLTDYLKDYYIIGGMPEVVQAWIDNHDYEETGEIQDSILSAYHDDFSKYVPIRDVEKMTMVWDSIPVQLAKDNQKFVFSHVKKGARAKDLEGALQWLKNAGLIVLLNKIETPMLPLSGREDTTYFKLFMSDVGLLRRKANIYHKTILGETEDYDFFRGAIAENYVLLELIKMGLPVWFWQSGNTAEVDVLTEYNGKVIPVEVKSAERTRAKSLRQFINKYQPKEAFKFSLKNSGDSMVNETHLYSLPLYCVFRLKDYLGK